MTPNALFTLSVFISTIFFPWPFTALLAVGASVFEPLVPFAAGIFADTLYYSGQASSLPLFSLCGLLVSIGAVFVRNRLRTGMMA